MWHLLFFHACTLWRKHRQYDKLGMFAQKFTLIFIKIFCPIHWWKGRSPFSMCVSDCTAHWHLHILYLKRAAYRTFSYLKRIISVLISCSFLSNVTIYWWRSLFTIYFFSFSYPFWVSEKILYFTGHMNCFFYNSF